MLLQLLPVLLFLKPPQLQPELWGQTERQRERKERMEHMVRMDLQERRERLLERKERWVLQRDRR